MHEMLDHLLQGSDIHLLANNTILNQTILGKPAPPQVNTKLYILKHNPFQWLLPGSVSLRSDQIMKSLQCILLLPNIYQLCNHTRHENSIKIYHGNWAASITYMSKSHKHATTKWKIKGL
jgi:hypothetical protein